LPQYLDFFRRDFHPNQHDTDALLEQWRETLFGANGLLTEQLEKPKPKSRKRKLH